MKKITLLPLLVIASCPLLNLVNPNPKEVKAESINILPKTWYEALGNDLSKEEITSVKFTTYVEEGYTLINSYLDTNISLYQKENSIAFVSEEIIQFPKDSSSLFEGLSNITSFYFINANGNTYTTNIDRMFASCSKLETIDLQPINFYNVHSASDIFYNCVNLKKVISPRGLNSVSIPLFNDIKFVTLESNKFEVINNFNNSNQSTKDIAKVAFRAFDVSVDESINLTTSDKYYLNKAVYDNGYEAIISNDPLLDKLTIKVNNKVLSNELYTYNNLTGELSISSSAIKGDISIKPYEEEDNDRLILEQFISNYLYMDQDIEGQCITYYPLAKSAFNELDESIKELFLTSEEYELEKERLLSWASYHNDILTISGITAKSSLILNNAFDISLILIISLISISGILVSYKILTKRRKHQ